AGAGAALVAALADGHGTVRRAAATGLRELVEVLPATPELGAALTGRLAGTDALVRATALDVLRALRLGDSATFRAGVDDADHRVRIEAIRGLVSLDEADLVAAAAADPSREVRVWVAKGLGLIGKPSPALAVLARDHDPLVRAAALESSGTVGTPLEARAVQGLADPAWQVRVGAARCLAAADRA
ncbi:HEAT repeat domain-containing protein, partial [Nonomuraea lactucae]|uniref:HEAT repeat domain-containing protein n=1 Tax=Nonomuraea lactucae TaxID=2249762 RepID=UPI0019651FA8